MKRVETVHSVFQYKNYQTKLTNVRFQTSQLSTSSNVQWEEVIKLFPNGAENVYWSQGRLEKLTQEKPI